MSNRRPPDDHELGKEIVPVSGCGSKVPAPKYRNFFANFKALTDAFDEQIKAYDELISAWQKRNQRVNFYYQGDDVDDAQELWGIAREGAEQCLADLEQLRTMKWKSIDIYHPSADFLLWRIGEMLKVWPDKLSDEPAANYAEYMAEHLAAKDLNIMIWESVFFDFEENRKTKPPSLAEVLELMDKYKRRWERRLAAIDAEQIKRAGEETVFAREFKNAVFKDAALEYLDAHGYADLAAGVRDGELLPYYVAIQAAAMSEGLSELVALMETSGIVVNSKWQQTDPFEEAKRILVNKKHVRLEWQLLLKNAERRVNHDKAFVCISCGAGYKDWLSRCTVCDSHTAVVSHAKWEEQFAPEQQTLAAELQVAVAELQLKLQRQLRGQKRREKLGRPPNKEARLWWGQIKEQREAQRERWTQEGDCHRARERWWGQVAEQQLLEEEHWDGLERAQEEWWEQIILEDPDPWSEMSGETFAEIMKNGVPELTDKERAKRVAKERAEQCAKEKEQLAKEKRVTDFFEKRLEARLFELIEDLAIDDLQDQQRDLQDQQRKHDEEIHELWARLSRLE